MKTPKSFFAKPVTLSADPRFVTIDFGIINLQRDLTSKTIWEHDDAKAANADGTVGTKFPFPTGGSGDHAVFGGAKLIGSLKGVIGGGGNQSDEEEAIFFDFTIVDDQTGETPPPPSITYSVTLVIGRGSSVTNSLSSTGQSVAPSITIRLQQDIDIIVSYNSGELKIQVTPGNDSGDFSGEPWNISGKVDFYKLTSVAI